MECYTWVKPVDQIKLSVLCSTRQTVSEWTVGGPSDAETNRPLSLSLSSDCVVQTEGSEEQRVWYAQRSSPAVSDASGSAVRGADWSSSESVHELPALSAYPVCNAAATQHVRLSNTLTCTHMHLYKGFYLCSEA